MSAVTYPCLSGERYAQVFELFVSLSMEYPFMESSLRTLIDRNCRNGFNLLDIGAGKGLFIRDVLLQSDVRPNLYTCYEPNAEHFNVLEANVAGVSGRVELLNQPFTPGTKLEARWDVVLMSHCLYWMQPVQPRIQNALTGLKSGGLLVIFLQPPAGLYMIQNFFGEEESSVEGALNQHFSSRELIPVLQAMAVNYTEQVLPGWLDLTPVWSDAQALQDLGSFFLGFEISQLPESRWQQVVQMIKVNTLQLEGRKLFNQPTSLIVLEKPCG